LQEERPGRLRTVLRQRLVVFRIALIVGMPCNFYMEVIVLYQFRKTVELRIGSRVNGVAIGIKEEVFEW